MTMVVWGVLLAGVVGFNLYASLLCMRSTIAEPRQKLFQLIFVWVVPLFGAAMVVYIAGEATRRDVTRGWGVESSADGDGSAEHPMWNAGAHAGGGDSDAGSGDGGD